MSKDLGIPRGGIKSFSLEGAKQSTRQDSKATATYLARKVHMPNGFGLCIIPSIWPKGGLETVSVDEKYPCISINVLP